MSVDRRLGNRLSSGKRQTRIGTLLTGTGLTETWLRGLVSMAVVIAIPLSASFSHAQQGPAQYPMKDTGNISPLGRTSNQNGTNNSAGDEVSPGDNQKRMEALNAMRQKEMAADSAKLLALATELKADVDKSGKDTLSLDVVKKAEQIEKLAKSVREKNEGVHRPVTNAR